MSSPRIKLTIATIGIVAAVGYLASAGFKEGWVYYLEVDAFVANIRYHDQRVRLHGTVAEQDLESHPGRLTAQFVLLGEADRVPVVYNGVIPDTFKAGRQVVVEGRLGDDGVFQADVMMTKCASKYQAQEHSESIRNEE